MAKALFERDDESFLPTELSRSPWSPRAVHAGPPGALITRAFEALEGDRWWVVRLTLDIMGEIPMAPLRIETSLERSGRSVQLLGGRAVSPGGETLLRAFAWRVRRAGPLPLPPPVDSPPAPPPAPQSLPAYERPVPHYTDFFGDGVDKRLFGGNVEGPGRAGMWFRLRVPLLPGETPTPLQTLVAVVDSANGISAAVPWDEFVFPNTDLGVYLAREPQGEWIAVDAVTYLDPGGRGISDTALFDTQGFVGRANQALFLDQRNPSA